MKERMIKRKAKSSVVKNHKFQINPDGFSPSEASLVTFPLGNNIHHPDIMLLTPPFLTMWQYVAEA